MDINKIRMENKIVYKKDFSCSSPKKFLYSLFKFC